MKRLQAAGYKQYEVSNFARPGKQSRHNTIYWRNLSYYGFGAGAHGYANGFRHVNVKAIQDYIDAADHGLPRLETFEVAREESMEDFMMIGLRLLEGVSASQFNSRYSCDMDIVFGKQLTQLTAKGLLEKTAEGYRLTEQGLLFGNDVFSAFIQEISSVRR
jgi:oxygen-independent coproporphyrinogen-3 oxidase